VSDTKKSSTTSKPTSSQESEDGATRYGWLGGQTRRRSGRDRALASRSAQQEGGLIQMMRGTSGQCGFASSESAALQSSLESRLQEALENTGSQLYALTWRQLTMPLGPPVSAQRVQERRIPGHGSFGVPTPVASDWKGSKKHGQRRGSASEALENCPPWVRLDIGGEQEVICIYHGMTAAKCSCPAVEEWTSDPYGERLPGAQSNPAFLLWLMGFPGGWASTAPSKYKP